MERRGLDHRSNRGGLRGLDRLPGSSAVMKVPPLPPRWLRRLLIDPAIVLIVALALISLPLWIVGAASVSRYVPGNWRILRIAWFLFLYLMVEAVSLIVM